MKDRDRQVEMEHGFETWTDRYISKPFHREIFIIINKFNYE